MLDDVKMRLDNKLGVGESDLAPGVREKENDLIQRQIILCQDAAIKGMKEYITSVDQFEAMLFEQIEKWNVHHPEMFYDSDTLRQSIIDKSSLARGAAMPLEMEHHFAREKFKRLYVIYKDAHMPIVVEGRV